MSSYQTLQLRDLSKSPFPLTLKWDTLRYRWHDSYPTGVSPGIEYPFHRIEKLLIYAHSPAWNANSVASPPSREEHERLHVINGGVHRLLLPEVSGARFTDVHWNRPKSVMGS